MNEKTPSRAVRLNVLFTVLAAAGTFMQYLVGVPGFPKIPPGPIILVAVAVLVFVLAARFRWIIVLGLAAPAFVTIGGIIQGGIFARMADIGNLGFFTSTWIQQLALFFAVNYGIAGVVRLFRRSGDIQRGNDSALLVR